MNLIKQTKELEINGDEYILCFDMNSIPIYKAITGKSFLQSSANIGRLECDEDMLGFIGASLRHKETPNKPIGIEVFDFSTIGILIMLSNHVIDILVSSMPQDISNSKKK